MIVLGIDPGATIGLALLDVPDTWRRGAPSRAGKARVVAVGCVRPGGLAAVAVQVWLSSNARDVVGLVGVERPMGYAFAAARVGGLLDAAWQGGELASWARFNAYADVRAVPAGD